MNASGHKLDAGDLTLTGNGRTVQLSDSGTGYEGTIGESVDIPGLSSAAPALGTGTWVMNGNGGRDVGRFSASMEIQDVFKSTLTISAITRGQPLQINWTGGGGDRDSVNVMVGTVGIFNNGPVNNVIIQCSARASDRRLTVPADLTGQLDRNAASAYLALSSAIAGSAHFSAPLLSSGTLDGASVVAVTEFNAQVKLQ